MCAWLYAGARQNTQPKKPQTLEKHQKPPKTQQNTKNPP